MAQQRQQGFPWQFEGGCLHKLLRLYELYHERSKKTRADKELMRRAQHDPLQRTAMHSAERALQEHYERVQYGSKQYRRSPRMALPPLPQQLGDLADAIRHRRSVRHFGGLPISLVQLAALLFCGYGVTGYEDPQRRCFPRRAVPSGGGLYPLEVYPLVLAVEGLTPGVYHYEAYTHALELLTPGTLDEALAQHLLHEELAIGPAVVVVLSGLFERSSVKYDESGYRYTLLEAGHVGHALSLAATALGLGACPVAGFVEDGVNDLVGLDGVDETALYLLVIGQRW
jgi:SagB-type dehydrogenase family enzyme